MAPIKKLSAGSISCALWENEATVDGRTVSILKAPVERRHKDGTWKSSGSFSRSEIPLVILCLVKAFAAMAGEKGKPAEEEVGSMRLSSSREPLGSSEVKQDESVR